jgi:hypothetical protein
MHPILFWTLIAAGLFLYTAWAFAIYIGVKNAYKQFDLPMKITYGVPVITGYITDWLFGATVLTLWFLELPDLTEATISQRTQKHFWDSVVARYIFTRILLIDPVHLGGAPEKPRA